MKVLAYNLPAYHRIPENDAWWGEGFTEWVNVKKSKPLFKGHNQPREPIDENYYDLSDPNALKQQMELAQENGLYGFCYYHYWFNGKLLLQKPLEQMLSMDKKINYCFCWANEPWVRTWDGKDKDVLMSQYYGGEPEWEAHFQYLLPFFKDSFYIKKNGKPVFVLYRTNDIPECETMISYFDKRCKDNGFDGIYLIEERNSFQSEITCKNAEAILDFEPMYTLTHDRTTGMKIKDKFRQTIFNMFTGNELIIYSYDSVWERILKRKDSKSLSKPIYRGAFVDWDNTPRKKERGLVILGANPTKFKKHLIKLLAQVKKDESEFVFLNAWNEWAEGTYLEPDERYGHSYLKVLKEALEKS
jgi:hypothetical protein